MLSCIMYSIYEKVTVETLLGFHWGFICLYIGMFYLTDYIASVIAILYSTGKYWINFNVNLFSTYSNLYRNYLYHINYMNYDSWRDLRINPEFGTQLLSEIDNQLVSAMKPILSL